MADSITNGAFHYQTQPMQPYPPDGQTTAATDGRTFTPKVPKCESQKNLADLKVKIYVSASDRIQSCFTCCCRSQEIPSPIPYTVQHLKEIDSP